MARFDVGLILGNRDLRLLGRVPVIFREGLRVQPIREQHLGAILGKHKSLADRIDGRTRYVLVENRPQNITNEEVDRLATLIRFTHNFFAEGRGVEIFRVFLFRQATKTWVERNFQTASDSYSADTQDPSFRLRAGTTPDEIQTLFGKLDHAVDIDRHLQLTLSRFNSCLLRDNEQEFVIDASIALESMIASQTEIAFRFALYNSHIGTTAGGSKEAAFSVLRKLYKKRSNIVHGSADAVVKAEAEKTQLLNVMRTAILYRVDYLHRQGMPDWQTHINRLSLGYDESVWR